VKEKVDAPGCTTFDDDMDLLDDDDAPLIKDRSLLSTDMDIIYYIYTQAIIK
jgi:hypothetical protein